MAYTATVTGTRTSSTALAANVKPDIDSTLKVLEPYQTPILQWLHFSNKASVGVSDKYGKFRWFEDELFPHQTQAKAAITASTTTLTLTSSNVNDKTIFKLDDVVFIEDNLETAWVSSVTGGGGADVVLTSLSGSNLTNVEANCYFRVIGASKGETSGKPVAQSTKEIEKYNYLNIMKELVSTSGRDQAGKTYTNGTSHADQTKKKMLEMKFRIERNYLYSMVAGTHTASDGSVASHGAGLLGIITTNVQKLNGLTESQWDNYIKGVAAKGSGKKIHFCGMEQLLQINKIVKDKVGSLPATVTTSYGVDIMKYIHPGLSSLKLVYHPLLEGNFAYAGYTLDEENVIPRHCDNDEKGSRKFRMETDVQTPGSDTKETMLLADVGMQLCNEETHGFLLTK